MASSNFKSYLRETQDISLGEFLPGWYDNTDYNALRESVYDYNRRHRSPAQQHLFSIGEGMQNAGIISGALGIFASPFSFKTGVIGMGAGATSAYLGSKLKRVATPNKYKDYLDRTLGESSDNHYESVQKIIKSPKFRKDLDTEYILAMDRYKKNNPKEIADANDIEYLVNMASGEVDYNKVLTRHKVPRKVSIIGAIPQELQPLYNKYKSQNSKTYRVKTAVEASWNPGAYDIKDDLALLYTRNNEKYRPNMGALYDSIHAKTHKIPFTVSDYAYLGASSLGLGTTLVGVAHDKPRLILGGIGGMLGTQLVYSKARNSAKIKTQAGVRNALEMGLRDKYNLEAQHSDFRKHINKIKLSDPKLQAAYTEFSNTIGGQKHKLQKYLYDEGDVRGEHLEKIIKKHKIKLPPYYEPVVTDADVSEILRKTFNN